MPVRIVSDSACDLPPALCEELGIEIVPLTIRFGADELVDRVELTTAAFWERLARTTVLPETAAPSVGAFESAFRSLHERGADGIVCINLSSRMSATMQSAEIAAKALDGVCPVTVIDSESASMGIGMLVLHAARLARSGADLDTIVASVEEARSRSHVLFTIDTLEYLRKGGRIGGAEALLGSMLSIKPVITVAEGAVEPVSKVRTRSKALRYVVDHVKEQPVESIYVLHAQAADVDDFVAMLEPIVANAEIVVAEIGPVVGVHTGPGTIGATWFAARDALAKPLPASFDSSTDEDLATRAGRGDRGALDALLARHLDRIHAVCRRVLGDPDDALDATQEALIAIARGVGRFDGRSRFTTWMYRVATNAALDEARRKRRRPVPTEPGIDTATTTPDPSGAVDARLDVDAALATLAPDFRAAVVLRDLAGLEYSEIATVLGIPIGTVRSRIARGRALVADYIGNQAGPPDRPTAQTLDP